MERNLHKRIEVAFPILDKDLAKRVIEESFDAYLADNTQAWLLQPDGHYKRMTPGPGEPAKSAQARLLAKLAESS